MIEEYLELELFTLGDMIINLGHLLVFLILSIGSFFIYKKVIKEYLPKFFKVFKIAKIESNDFRTIFRNIIILIVILVFVNWLNWDFVFYAKNTFYISVILIIKILLIHQIVKLLMWGINNIIHSYYLERKVRTKEEADYDTRKEISIISNIRTVVYFTAIITVIKLTNLNFKYTTGLNTESVSDDFNISIIKILTAILIIFIARLVIWTITQLVLFNIYNKKKIPFAQRFAINQLILYVVYVLAIFVALNYLLGAKMTVIYGGAAALLVGVGLGLQQTFNDFFSGLVLLFERSVGVGDVIVVEDTIGRVTKIGMRSSLIQTRDLVTIVVPNSKMVNLNIQNISHEYQVSRFEILISVAYGSDTSLVEKLLIESIEGVDSILKHPSPEVQFVHFGDNGLDFKLFFYTKELFRVEKLKSKIRFQIDGLFRENDITIPFPQRTVWINKEA